MPELVKMYTREERYEISVEELAQMFCGMNDRQQAEFWSHIAGITDDWGRDSAFQWQAMRNAIDRLDDNGDALRAFQDMAQYAC